MALSSCCEENFPIRPSLSANNVGVFLNSLSSAWYSSSGSSYVFAEDTAEKTIMDRAAKSLNAKVKTLGFPWAMYELAIVASRFYGWSYFDF